MGTIDGVYGYFVYLALLFGAVGGPLLWGRVAAWLMRCTAAIKSESETQLQCFVDDPLMAVQGTPRERVKRISRILLLWRALNFKVAWHKTQRGQAVEWIGALYTYVYEADGTPIGVDITVTEGKVEKCEIQCGDSQRQLGLTESSSNNLRASCLGPAAWCRA